MPAERIAALEEIAQHQPVLGQEGPARAAGAPRHDARQARPASSTGPIRSARRYPPSDTSLPARYARAISTYRHGEMRDALAQIDALIQAQPNNPYFHELKGQALLEGGRARRGDRAAAARGLARARTRR